jgi:2-alkyl-3-oxoalkanoate reductase
MLEKPGHLDHTENAHGIGRQSAFAFRTRQIARFDQGRATMRVFVAGIGSALERVLVPQLIENGYQVTTLACTPDRAESTRALGGELAVADPLNAEQLTQAVHSAAPNVIVDLFSALPSLSTNAEHDALTKRFEILDTLLGAARRVGARRFIAQSYCGWPLTLATGPLGKEEDAFHPRPPAKLTALSNAIRHREETIQSTHGVQTLILRCGFLYGPGTEISREGSIATLIRERKLPLVSSAHGVWSFIHVADAARATVVAVSQGAPGIYNVVDSEPAPVADWLPLLGQVLSAPAPRSLPAWLARLFVGDLGVSMMTESRGASNRKAISGLGWQPMFANYRQGFLKGL